jgi:hypothetical protein
MARKTWAAIWGGAQITLNESWAHHRTRGPQMAHPSRSWPTAKLINATTATEEFTA